jgi:hypothetical protein
MAAEKDAAGRQTAQARDGGSQPLLIAFCASSRRRPGGTRLPERQIASQYGETRRTECVCQSHQKWRVAVCAGAVRQHQTVSAGIRCEVQKTPHCDIFRRRLQKFSNLSHGQRRLMVRFHSATATPVSLPSSAPGTT